MPSSSSILADEATGLTDEELNLAIIPALGLIDSSSTGSYQDCLNDDVMLRCTRATANKHPTLPHLRSAVASGNVSRHAAALAERLEKLCDWRSRPDVKSLLTSRLEGDEAFHSMWPCTKTGVDASGHPIFVERLSDIEASSLTRQFTLHEILLFRTQVVYPRRAHIHNKITRQREGG